MVQSRARESALSALRTSQDVTVHGITVFKIIIKDFSLSVVCFKPEWRAAKGANISLAVAVLEFPTKRSAFIGNSIGQTLPFVRGLLWSCLYICLSVRLSICFCFCFVLFVCLFFCLFVWHIPSRLPYLDGLPPSRGRRFAVLGNADRCSF